MFALRKKQRERLEKRFLKQPSQMISSINVDINYISEKQCIKNYRFKKADVDNTLNMINWSGR